METSLKLDEPTEKETRLSFAKTLVEIKANSEHPEEAYIIMHDGENTFQKIKYERVPPKRVICACFGHSTVICLAKKV